MSCEHPSWTVLFCTGPLLRCNYLEEHTRPWRASMPLKTPMTTSTPMFFATADMRPSSSAATGSVGQKRCLQGDILRSSSSATERGQKTHNKQRVAGRSLLKAVESQTTTADRVVPLTGRFHRLCTTKLTLTRDYESATASPRARGQVSLFF